MAIADQLNQAKNNALQTTTANVGSLSGTQNYTAPNLNTKLMANNPAKLMDNSPTVYASGTDLANAHNVYGNTVNYGDVNNPNLRSGDIIAGGSAVTPKITDDMINSAGAQRLSGNTATDTLAAMQRNSKTTLPQYYQNTNNQALSNTSYQNLSPNVDVNGYKNQISNAINNAGNYHYVNSNNVGMDNTPYANVINNALNNSNSQSSNYQNAIQQALNTYNNSAPNLSDLYAQGQKAFLSGKDTTQTENLMKQYYPQQYAQMQNALKNNSSLSDIQGIANNAANNTNKPVETPQSTADYIKSMTDKINSLYDTQKNNVGLYYEQGKKQAAQQYQGLRNQASVADQQNLNKLKESMAQQGLFNSGDNITAQTGINNEYAGNLAGYNQQEQNYYDTVNNQIAQQKANYDTQQAQAMMDLYGNADNRSFKMADLNSNQKQQAFQNAMAAINSQYGIGQSQFGNTLKGTTTTYGMGRDTVGDQRYNNDSQMKADQMNYGRDQDYFNNQLRAISQQYGMDNDQIQNLLNYAKFNSSEDQRQYSNTTGTNKSNSDLTQQQTDNSYRQGQADTSNNQFNQTLDFQKQQEANKVDYQNRQLAQALQLAQMQAAARNRSGGGGGRSSGGSRSSGSSYRRSSSGGSSGEGSVANSSAAQSILNAAKLFPQNIVKAFS